MTTMTTHVSRPPLSRAAAAVWRGIRRPFRWLWRQKLKIALWTTTLVTLAWQYENWHGRRAYQEQLALFRSEYGDLKWSDFSTPRIPDEENFFAAPVFETFVVKRADTPSYESEKEAAIWKAIPHARFQEIKMPEIKSLEREVPVVKSGNGLELLDIAAWAKAEAAAGKQRPEGFTDEQWIHSSMPPDEVVKGFMEAARRPHAQVLPCRADYQKICDELNNPYAYRLPMYSGILQAGQQLSLRGRVAARAGDKAGAQLLTGAIAQLTAGYMAHQTLVTTLAAFCLEPIALDSVAEGLACQCWEEDHLHSLSLLLENVDEESGLLRALYSEGFLLHLWPGNIQEWHRRHINDNWVIRRKWSWRPEHIYGGLCAIGPDGWIDANLGNNLRWWRQFLMPDSAGDQLMGLKERIATTLPEICKEMVGPMPKGAPSPRKFWAAVTIPNFGGIADSALKNQTRRRELLLAIAIERHFLAKGTLPREAGELVPAFIDAIPGDPWQPGSPLRWEIPERDATQPGAPAIRYRILSANKEATLGFPEKLQPVSGFSGGARDTSTGRTQP